MIQPILKIRDVGRCLSRNSTLIICRCLHSKKTHYDSLNLKSNCTNDEIRQAFTRLSKEYHPDTSKANYTEKDSNKFQEIIEAYRVLSKTESRNAYNAKISKNNSDPNFSSYNYDYERTRRNRPDEYYSRNGPHQRNPFNSHGPFDSSNKEHYDAWNANPFLSFNRNQVFGIFFGLFVISIMFLSSRARSPMKDFKDK